MAENPNFPASQQPPDREVASLRLPPHSVEAVQSVLGEAIRQGGTTLRDYVNADGTPGYFRQKLYVYERDGQPCRRCGTTIRKLAQGQRSTYFCPSCQK